MIESWHQSTESTVDLASLQAGSSTTEEFLSAAKKELNFIQKFLGPRPFIHHSHQFLLKLIHSWGGKIQTHRWGDDVIGAIVFPMSSASAKKKGRKRRIVFVPGLGDSPVSWMPVLLPLKPLLKRDFDEMIFLDFPGFGGFLAREKCFDSMDRFLSCSNEFLTRLRPDVVVAHSLGGWVAANYTAKADPEKQPKQLILFSPSGVVGDETSRKAWADRFDQVISQGFSELRPHVFRKEPFWFKLLVNDIAGFMSTPELLSFFRSVKDRHLISTHLKKVVADTWLIWGSEDTLIPSAWMEEWVKRLPKEHFGGSVHLKKTGHSPQAERPAISLLVLTEILKNRRLLSRIPSPYWSFSRAR